MGENCHTNPGKSYRKPWPISITFGYSTLRLSACTCPGGDHPGPSVNVGRGAPEIDIFEAQVSYSAPRGGRVGTVSQSAQVAPCT